MNNINEFLIALNPVNWAKNGIESALTSLLESLITSSYYVCMIGGLIGIFLYIFGYEKGKKYPLTAIGIYLIINIIGSAILNAK